MKVVILAGGLGTRLSEETELKPKPMVTIGGKPILWHIMKIYSTFGFNDFVICLGYKGYVIKEYFANYFMHMSDVTFDLSCNAMEVLQNHAEPWRVTLVDTGVQTLTGGRVKRVERFLEGEPFMLTYGDGVADIDIDALLRAHRESGRACTVTAVQPPGRFGALAIEDGGGVSSFLEKPLGDGGWINGGFIVAEPEVLDYLEGDHVSFEGEVLTRLAQQQQLNAYKHGGFWQPMDTLRDKNHLEELWKNELAPWKIWGDLPVGSA